MNPISPLRHMSQTKISPKVIDEANDIARGIQIGMTRTSGEIKEVVTAEITTRTINNYFLKGLIEGIKKKIGKA